MQLSAIIIILIVGVIFIYIFYLIGIYIKLENRCSLILSKFEEIDKQLEEKQQLVDKLLEIYDSKDISDINNKLKQSISVNDKIKYSKILDSLIIDIDTKDKKVSNIISKFKDIIDKTNYSKEIYNDCLYEYNIILSSVNGKIIRKIFKYNEYNTY